MDRYTIALTGILLVVLGIFSAVLLTVMGQSNWALPVMLVAIIGVCLVFVAPRLPVGPGRDKYNERHFETRITKVEINKLQDPRLEQFLQDYELYRQTRHNPNAQPTRVTHERLLLPSDPQVQFPKFNEHRDNPGYLEGYRKPEQLGLPSGSPPKVNTTERTSSKERPDHRILG